ncbi:MAG: hypothetical protein KAS32_20520 [Candidatus Peribacteraceae bacterium]|nr:hypothetical protein [Candidatus Peribacteraceae bacterium]
MMENMEKEYHTVSEVAFKFDVCTRTILNGIKAGKIRAFRVGPGKRSPFRIHHSEIQRIEVQGIHEINPDMEV